MTRDEALSRLLAGDLPPDQAARWRSRIDAEPEVAAAWARLQQLAGDLEALPATAPPEALVQAVVDRSPRTSRRHVVAPALVAAALLLIGVWVAQPSPVPTLELVHGEQHVVGRAELLAADVRVAVDGEAEISVEPVPPLLRENQQEVPMQWGTVGAFGAGVVVTVAVMQGVAWVTAPDGERTEVVAGETHRVQGTASGARAEPRAVQVAVPAGDGAPEAQIEALEQAIAKLTFERDALRGQVAAAGGEPIPWPSNLAAALAPDQFESTLRAILGEADIDVTEVDCSEYPCVAVLDMGETDDPMATAQHVSDVLREGAKEVLGTDAVGMGLQVEAHQDSEGGPTSVQLGLALGGEDIDPREPRVATRMSDLMSGWRAEPGEAP